MDYWTFNLVVFATTALSVFCACWFLGNKLDQVAKKIERRNQGTVCNQKGCKRKTKGLLRAND